MFVALIAISIYISYVDIKWHLITNRALLFSFFTFLTLSPITRSEVHPLSGLLVLVLAPPVLWLGVGAGDIKLLAILTFFFIPFSWQFGTRFLLAFSLISSTLLALRLIKSHSLAGSLALAPAICGAVIWCAR
jgi:Flp pilus assembly protein protease CpaA